MGTASDLVTALGLRGANLLGAIGLNVTLTAILGPEDLGGWFLATTTAYLVQLLFQIGLAQASVHWLVTAQVTGDLGRTARRFRTLIMTSAILGVAGTVGAWGLGPVIAHHLLRSPALEPLLPIVALQVAPAVLCAVVSEATRAFGHHAWAMLASGTLANLGLLACVLVGHAWGWQVSAKGALTLNMLFMYGNCIVLLLVNRRNFAAPATPGRTDAPGHLIIESWPNWLAGVLFFLLTTADLWILSHRADDAQVGQYGFAARLAGTMLLPGTVIYQTLGPKISTALKSGRSGDAESVILRANGRLTLLAVAMYLGMTGALSFAGTLLLGDRAPGVLHLFLILGGGAVFTTLLGPGGHVLSWAGRIRVTLVTSTIATACSIGLGWMMLPHFGALGLAATFACGLAAMRVANTVLARRFLGLRVTRLLLWGPLGKG